MNQVTKWLAALLVALGALVSHAAPAQSDEDIQLTAVDWKSFERVGNHARLWLLRSFPETILLGHDLYPHRSQRIQYVIDCTDRSYALSQWVLTDGADGAGTVVWADRNDTLAFVHAVKGTLEAAVILAACSIDSPTAIARQRDEAIPQSSPLQN
jgi:hypothetical protein